MKRKRNIIILAVVLVALCGVIVVERVVTQHIDTINITDEIILTLNQDDLTGVSWKLDGESLEFLKTDGIWYCSEDADFPVNQDTMADFLTNFEEVHACFIIDDVNDYSQYGLDSPQCTVILTMGDEEIEVSMGSYSTMDQQRYISVGDGKVYLIEQDLMDEMITDRDQFMQQDSILKITTLTELTVSGEISMDIVHDEEESHSYTDSYHYYLVENGTYLTLDDSLVQSYLNTLTSISLTDYVTYTASREDLSDYGMDQPAYTFVIDGRTVSGEDDQEVILYVGIVEEKDEDGENSGITAYVRVEDSEIIYQLDDYSYETLAAGSYNTLRPVEVLSLDWDLVTGIAFTLDDTVYDVTVNRVEEEAEEEGEEDADAEAEETENLEETVYELLGQEIDFSAAQDTVDALVIDSFTSESPERQLEVAMTISLENENYPSVTVEIYQIDGEECLAVLNGETLGRIERSLVVDLREALTSIVLGLEV